MCIFYWKSLTVKFIIRDDYLGQSKALYIKNKAIEIPEDPTIKIIGEYWWKLGVSVVAITGLIFTLLQSLDLSDWIFNR